jgi:hypothetical protein
MDFNKEIVIKLKRQISDQVVQMILKVTGTNKQKKPWESLTRDYKNDLRGKVARIIIDWKENGVPSRFYSEIKLLSDVDVLKRFELKVIEEPNKGNMPNTIQLMNKVETCFKITSPVSMMMRNCYTQMLLMEIKIT